MNVSQFYRQRPSGKSKIPPNNYIPNNVKMNKNTKSNIVMQAKDDADLASTAIITCILSKLLNNLTVLSTFKVRNTRIVFTAAKLPPVPFKLIRINSKIDKQTTIPSSKFILSDRYFYTPTANSLTAISITKIQLNTKLALYNYSYKLSLIPQPLNDITTVFANTIPTIN